MNLSKDVKVTTALDYASGIAARNGAILDMEGYEGVLIITKFAVIAVGAVTTVKAQQGMASDLSDAADLAGTSIAVAADDDNQIFMTDIYKPKERYIRLVVGKDGVNAAAESAIYVQYGPRSLPVSNNVTDAVTTETHISPSEGTA